MPLVQGNKTVTLLFLTTHGISFTEQPFPPYPGSSSITFQSAGGQVAVGMLRKKGKRTPIQTGVEFFFVIEAESTLTYMAVTVHTRKEGYCGDEKNSESYLHMQC